MKSAGVLRLLPSAARSERGENFSLNAITNRFGVFMSLLDGVADCVSAERSDEDFIALL